MYDQVVCHKGLATFFRTGSKPGIQAHHATKLCVQLTSLNAAKKPDDMNAPGWRLQSLTGDMKGYYTITVNANWRVILRFDGKDTELVDYLDYH